MRTSFGIILAAAVSLGLLNQNPQTPLYTVLVPNRNDIIFSEEECTDSDSVSHGSSAETTAAAVFGDNADNCFDSLSESIAVYNNVQSGKYSDENVSDQSCSIESSGCGNNGNAIGTYRALEKKDLSSAKNTDIFRPIPESKIKFEPQAARSEADIMLDNALLSIIASSSDIASSASISSSAEAEETSVDNSQDYTQETSAEENITESLPETLTPENESGINTVPDEAANQAHEEKKKSISYYQELPVDPAVSYGITDNSVISVYDHGTKSYIRMTLREYTIGVTAAEMPVYFGTEALRAQAIAARTYAIYKLARGSSCDEHPDAAVCNAPAHCCAYSYSAPDEVRAAVEDTSNTVVVYDGECICAAWHSSSDGYTRAAENVWGSRVAYLCSVPTGESRGASGHGVGMSQYGAANMAENGAAACDILTHYYTGGMLMRTG